MTAPHPSLRQGDAVPGPPRRPFALPGGVGDALAHTVSNLGYRPVAHGEADNCVAALVALPPGGGEAWDRSLESCRALASNTPVIVLANALDFARRRAVIRAGAVAVLNDPPDLVMLNGWLRELDPTLSAPLSVLVVDDDPFAAEAFALTLEAAGMVARFETDAEGALGALEAERPDVVLLDVNMPDTDGIELAGIVRQDRTRLSLPILFLSGERDRDRRLAARALGGDDFITKPVDPDLLVRLVRMRGDRARALTDMATRDRLTGLPNRARFDEALAARAALGPDAGPASVALIDVDHFKALNDTHGHATGDRMLRLLAGELMGGLRCTDEIARWGGEEFAVLLPGAAPPAAAGVIDRVRRRFAAARLDVAGERVGATFSAGVAGCPPGVAGEGAMERADAALYAAKRAGRDRTIIHESEADQ